MTRMSKQAAAQMDYFRSLGPDQFDAVCIQDLRDLVKMVAEGDLIHIDEAPDVMAAWDRGDSPFPRTAA